ncbi:nuclear transport factor 2 family protein [Streptomyces sp. QL37]|uniref:nuclear transport factor 2 family protein n=1 Tax=Streptomyces sp. QL37 TaxID=2093747 RepID=UPI000CF257C9|nr:nuclear transport factor 2 family protein [Streptomyces sp. QL37]PPQ55753.1 hypothetical protein C5F59_02910 [Streptomyces sp. QL37]
MNPSATPATTRDAARRNHPHTEILRRIYADLTKLAEYADEDIVLHRADREAEDSHAYRGLRAVMVHERALLRATGGSLVMDVESICANDHFGAVLGTLRAGSPHRIAMPFCGLWRFTDGRIVEHWENAQDAARLQSLLRSPGAAPA